MQQALGAITQRGSSFFPRLIAGMFSVATHEAVDFTFTLALPGSGRPEAFAEGEGAVAGILRFIETLW